MRWNQNNDLEYKEVKYSQPEQQEEKRMQKSEDTIRSFRDKVFQYFHHRGARRRRERARN